MTLDYEIKGYLEKFIEKNRPAVLLHCHYFFIFRSTKFGLVSSLELRLGDIRVFDCEAKDLVTGFSDYQWNDFIRRMSTFMKIVEYAKEHNLVRNTE